LFCKILKAIPKFGNIKIVFNLNLINP